MNRFLIILSIGAMMVAACQKDVQVAQDFQVVDFSVVLPDAVGTKATTLGSGEKATQLYYAVYRGTSNEEGAVVERVEPMNVPDQPIAMSGKKAKVSLKLVKGVKYDIVFWAQAPDAPYAFDMEKGKVTVTDAYSGTTVIANDELRDAFCALVDDYEVTSEPLSVPMFRPFAQINFCADDYKRVTDLHLSMTSSIQTAQAMVPSVLNLLTGAVDTPVNVQFVATAVPAASGETLNIQVDGVSKEYSVVSMNYILADKVSANIDVLTATFNYNGESVVIDVPNVPYQRNWRTNIYGSLFTDVAVFDIEIKPAFLADENKNYK